MDSAARFFKNTNIAGKTIALFDPLDRPQIPKNAEGLVEAPT
jgi:hypothetical protein